MKRNLSSIVLALGLLQAGAAHADITIGTTLSLTGPLSSLGIPVKASLAFWPERIAGEKITLVLLDDASDSTQAVSNVRRFALESKADVIIGSSGVPAVLAVAPVAAEFKTVQLALAPVPRPGGADDWTFTLPQPITLMADALARRMVADKIKRVAFLGWNEAYGEAWNQLFKLSAQKAGLQIVATERFAPPDTNITAQVLKVQAAQPDAVLIVGAGTGAALPQITLRERGYTGPIYQTHGAGSPDLVRVGGPKMDGAILPAGPMLVAEQLADANPIKKVALAYVQPYEQKHGAMSRTQFGGHAHDALQILQRIVPVALKRAKPGTPAFRQALRDALESEREIVLSHGIVNYTPTDHIGFDERGYVMLKIEKGQFKLLETGAAGR
ncbi:ABC transporter substrate-binding protein [Aquabacterium sp.]|uniref:ABC transporter substrate-binding protein n=1 Tax=Aquabacterium sp. TaxID=1872578 RepID=UPI002C031B90|nr:ABC transporter substrate-binding protein [Aquabacterium sp.]HSW08785.1 ABC transporter substrate-binding protein [Aquabacterium sp.]